MGNRATNGMPDETEKTLFAGGGKILRVTDEFSQGGNPIILGPFFVTEKAFMGLPPV